MTLFQDVLYGVGLTLSGSYLILAMLHRDQTKAIISLTILAHTVFLLWSMK